MKYHTATEVLRNNDRMKRLAEQKMKRVIRYWQKGLWHLIRRDR